MSEKKFSHDPRVISSKIPTVYSYFVLQNSSDNVQIFYFRLANFHQCRMENAKVGIVILAIYRQLSYCKLMPCTGTISLAFAPPPFPTALQPFLL